MTSTRQQDLIIAIENSDHDTISNILNSGVSPNFYSDDGETPLALSLICNDMESAQLLLMHNADINCADSSGFAPLYWAIMSERPDILSRFIEFNPDLSVAWITANENALHVAARSSPNKIFDIILANSEDGIVDHFNSVYATPLMEAVRNKKEHAVISISERTRNIDLTHPDGPLETALHIAASHPHEGIVRCLVSHNANKIARNRFGQRPIDIYLSENPEASADDSIANMLSR